MTLYKKILNLYSNLQISDFDPITGTIFLQNDGASDYIAKWEHPDYPQPTNEQLTATGK